MITNQLVPQDDTQDNNTHESVTRDEDSTQIVETNVVESTDPRYVFTPTIDIFEIEDGLVLRADLPGVSTESLDLQIQENRLTLYGKVKSTVPENAIAVHQEYQVGDFLRSFILSDHVDYERISAKLTNGVLEVILPKLAQSEPRKIQIQTD